MDGGMLKGEAGFSKEVCIGPGYAFLGKYRQGMWLPCGFRERVGFSWDMEKSEHFLERMMCFLLRF